MSDAKEVWHGEIAEHNPALYEVIHAAGLAHGKRMKGYLIWMAVRLIEMRRILKPTGSIYLHCDDCASRRLQAYPTLACAGMALLSFGPNERLKEHSNG